MTKIAFPLTLLVTALVCALAAAPAQAQGTRSYTAVSSAAVFPGLPSPGPACGSIQSPCRTLQAAFNVTAAGGEIDVLDPGEYGPLTITYAVSIQGHGWTTVTATGGATAITINAGASDKINIRGVLLDGLGTAGWGIVFNSGAWLHVEDSSIRNFSGAGIGFAPTAASHLEVSNTVVSDNAGGSGLGISVINAGSGAVGGVLDHVSIHNTVGQGIFVSAGGQTTIVVVRNSTVANTGTGLDASGAYAVIDVTRSTIKGNTTGWSEESSGTVNSWCDNVFTANGANNNTPPSGCFTYN